MGEADNEGKLSLSIFLSKKNLAALVLTLLLALKETCCSLGAAASFPHFTFKGSNHIRSHPNVNPSIYFHRHIPSSPSDDLFSYCLGDDTHTKDQLRLWTR